MSLSYDPAAAGNDSSYAPEAAANDEEEQYGDDPFGEEEEEEEEQDQPDAESAAIQTAGGRSQALVPRRDADDSALDALPSGVSGGAGLSSIHAGYLSHIRALQRTNGALTKKVAHLVALQGEHTRMKLIARQQRLLREKQLLLDSLAEMIISRGVMPADELTNHLQGLIEHGALDQTNPAKQKKELLDSKKENARLLAELTKLRKQVRAFEAGQPLPVERVPHAAASSGPASASLRAAQQARSAEHAALLSSMESERASHAALRDEFLSLSSAHTALQSSHHSLTLSLAEHKKLVETVTEENRSLRGYLQQWETSEERRILAEQQVMLLQEAAARAVGERENIFQEVRSFRVRVLALAEAKARGEEQAAQELATARRSEQAARDHAAALSKQLDLLKADVRASNDVVEWHRAQNVLHLTADAQAESRAKEKAQADEVARLQALTESWQSKYTLLLQKEQEELPHERVASFALLQENAGQRVAIAALETRVGELVAQMESDAALVQSATEKGKQAETEMAVLQRALQQMAIDLQGLQRALTDKSAQLQHALEVKIPRMRMQRANLASACQRQNEAIQELAAQLQMQPQGHHGRLARKSARDAKHGPSPATAAAPSAADVLPVTATASSSSRSKPHTTAQPAPAVDYALAASSFNVAAAPADSAAESAVESLTGLDSDIAGAGDTARQGAEEDQAAEYTDADAAIGEEFGAAPIAQDTAADAATSAEAYQSADAQQPPQPQYSDEWSDPSGVWARYTTDDGQAYYYFNTQTNESVWTDPLLPSAAPADADADAYAYAPASAAAAPVDVAEPAVAAVPDAAATSDEYSFQPATASSAFSPMPASVGSDLDLTPLPSERALFDDLPQLSARPNYAAAPTVPPVQEDEFGDPFAEENVEAEAVVAAASAGGGEADGLEPVEEYF